MNKNYKNFKSRIKDNQILRKGEKERRVAIIYYMSLSALLIYSVIYHLIYMRKMARIDSERLIRYVLSSSFITQFILIVAFVIIAIVLLLNLLNVIKRSPLDFIDDIEALNAQTIKNEKPFIAIRKGNHTYFKNVKIKKDDK